MSEEKQMSLRDAVDVFEDVVQDIDNFLIEVSREVLIGALPKSILHSVGKLSAGKLELPICAAIRAADAIEKHRLIFTRMDRQQKRIDAIWKRRFDVDDLEVNEEWILEYADRKLRKLIKEGLGE